MQTVIRTLAMYAFLLVLLRAAGKRTLSDITPFEFIMLLIIGEASQQALLGNDYSFINAVIVILGLVGIDIALSLVKQRWTGSEKYLEGQPVVLVDEGELVEEHLKKTRVDEADILEAARSKQGLASMEQVRFAVLEKSGGISIVPK